MVDDKSLLDKYSLWTSNCISRINLSTDLSRILSLKFRNRKLPSSGILKVSLVLVYRKVKNRD